MKVLSSSIILLILLCSTPCLAQKYSSEEDYRSKVYSKDKKDLMAEYLNLSKEEAEKFWPIYDLYESERRTLGDQRFTLLQSYLEEVEHIDDALAEDWLQKIKDFRMTYSKHLEDYTRRIQANVGGKRAVEFYELETYFRTDIRDRIYSEFPFVNE